MDCARGSGRLARGRAGPLAWIALLAALAGCGAPFATPAARACCDQMVSKSAFSALADADRCRLQALCERCERGDVCRVECMTEHRAGQVAGGCEHLCGKGMLRRPALRTWKAPAGFAACAASR